MQKKILLDFLQKNKEHYRNKYGITKIGLFGSYARCEEDEQSDIDVVVEIEKSMKNIHNFLNFKRELERSIGKEIDLGIESALKPVAKEIIQRDITYV